MKWIFFRITLNMLILKVEILNHIREDFIQAVRQKPK